MSKQYNVLVKVCLWQELSPDNHKDIDKIIEELKAVKLSTEDIYSKIAQTEGSWENDTSSERVLEPGIYATIEIWEHCCDEEVWDISEEVSGEQPLAKRLVWDNKNGFYE